MTDSFSPPARPSARTRLLDAALILIRQKGFAATSVDDLCAKAGVTKGAFFHHFPSKDALGVASAQHWAQVTGALFASASYHQPADPFDRLMAYLSLRHALLQGQTCDFTCHAGTLLQEIHASSPTICAAAYSAIADHAATLESDFQQAIDLYAPSGGLNAPSLALLTQSILQGAFILAKGQGSAAPVHDALTHLRHYLSLLFNKEFQQCPDIPISTA
jgi:TetR/AcrR family transcriptional regulator, transcriptional repressor for nem operon